MKKTFFSIGIFLICVTFSLSSFSQTLHYNGDSGPQIVVTQDQNGMMIVTSIPYAYNTPLRGDQYVPGKCIS